MATEIEPVRRSLDRSYMLQVVLFHRDMMDLESQIEASLHEDTDVFGDKIRDLRKREVEVLKHGAHNPWTPWIFSAATVSTVAAFFFMGPIGGVTFGATVFSIAGTGNGLLTDHRTSQAAAEQKLLNAEHLVYQKTVQARVEGLIGLEKFLQETTDVVRRMIEQNSNSVN